MEWEPICFPESFDPSLILLYLIGVVLGPAHMLFYLVWLQVLKVLAAGWCLSVPV